ncbi:MAG: hypothetical protein OEL66_10075, partial [Desulfobulbaceae bacterium]|nr:hypothetical protein [Desulfobulbaceae bacterium]
DQDGTFAATMNNSTLPLAAGKGKRQRQKQARDPGHCLLKITADNSIVSFLDAESRIYLL